MRQVLGERVRHVDADAVDAAIEPEPQDVEELGAHLGVVPVEVRLLGREQVQVPLAVGHPLPRRAAEDRQPVRGRLVAVRHRAPAGTRTGARSGLPGPAASAARNHACSLDVWFGTMSTSTRRPSPCASADERVHVVERAEQRVDGSIVGDVVAAVGQRRRVERRQPDRVDAEVAQVGQLRPDARDVADAIAIGVGERADVDLVDDRVPPPCTRRLRHECAATQSGRSTPADTSTAGPLSTRWSSSRLVTVSVPPGTSTWYAVAGGAWCRHMATTPAAQAPVPHERVSPTPRSHTRMAMCCGPRSTTYSMLTPVREHAGRSDLGHHLERTRSREVVDEADQVRVRQVQAGGRPHALGGGRIQQLPGPDRLRDAHVHADRAVVLHGQVAHPTASGDRQRPAGGKAGVDQVAGEHPDAVPAHLAGRSVGVAVVHEPLRGGRHVDRIGGLRGAHDPKHPVAADASPTVADRGNQPWGQLELAVDVRQQHEVVLRAVPLDVRDRVRAHVRQAIEPHQRSLCKITGGQQVSTPGW